MYQRRSVRGETEERTTQKVSFVAPFSKTHVDASCDRKHRHNDQLAVMACLAISNIVKSSLGPVGLDKMLVDQIGDVTITNDGATILKQLEVEHPAAKVLVELSDRQDKEVGDGTTSVVIIASELLKRANELIKQKIHPTTVIAGYKMAMKQAVKHIKKNLVIGKDQISGDIVTAAARTSMSSKIIGAENDFFSKMVYDAMKLCKRTNENTGKTTYAVNGVNILKVHGKSTLESELVDGYALQMTRMAQGMPTHVKNAKIALIDFPLQRHRMQMGINVVVRDVKELERIKKREADITKERIDKLIAAGVNVFLTTKGIDDLCAKYLVEKKCIGVRRVMKKDLQRIALATGGKLLLNLADLEGDETIDPSTIGSCDEVVEQEVGDRFVIYLRKCKGSGAATILLRGANDFMLDEVERSLHDSLMVVKRTLESGKVVAGGGAVEAACNVHLTNYSVSLGTREQLAVQEFADALLIIPKTLALNAAQDASDLVASLCAKHSKSQSKPDEFGQDRFKGLDLINGQIVDSVKLGVLEPAISKVKSLRFATEAAITILRIDDHIKMNPKEDPQGGGRGRGRR